MSREAIAVCYTVSVHCTEEAIAVCCTVSVHCTEEASCVQYDATIQGKTNSVLYRETCTELYRKRLLQHAL